MNISICSNTNICPQFWTFSSSLFSLNRFNGDSASWNKFKSLCLSPQNPRETQSRYACTQNVWELFLGIYWTDAKWGTENSTKGLNNIDSNREPIPMPQSEQGFCTKFGHIGSQLWEVQQEHRAFILRVQSLLLLIWTWWSSCSI